jgi:hypothetical protein
VRIKKEAEVGFEEFEDVGAEAEKEKKKKKEEEEEEEEEVVLLLGEVDSSPKMKG